MLSYLLLCLALSNTCLASEVELDGDLTLMLEHSLDMGVTWEPRGTLSLSRARTSIPQLTQGSLNSDNYAKMEDLCSNNQLYLIKVSGEGVGDLQSYASACSLLSANLSEQLTIFMDWRGNLVAANLATRSSLKSDKKSGKFDTRVQVQNMENGPTPDTAAYIQKMEEEKSRKLSGDKTENKSFFAKYWMYIVPMCIVLLINSAGAPENGGGGR